MITERYNYKKLTMAIATILAAMIIAGCVDSKDSQTPKAPETQLDILAKSASGLILENKGGDALVLKNIKISVKKEVDGKFVDGLNSKLVSDIQDPPEIEILAAGKKIIHTWKESLSLGEVLIITIDDVPSGKMIYNQKITVR